MAGNGSSPCWRPTKARLPPAGAGIPTIQGDRGVFAIGSVVGHPVVVVGSSRTDAGVHAKGQVAHFDTDQIQIAPEGLRRAMNHRLPTDILVRDIEPVSDSFDAITAAAAKRYQYFIWNAPDRNPFFPDLCWHRWQTLDVSAMRVAANYFEGEHDFWRASPGRVMLGGKAQPAPCRPAKCLRAGRCW